MRRSQLLLPPATPAHSRIWISLPRGIDAGDCAERAVRQVPTSRRSKPRVLSIANTGDGLATYATAITVLDQLDKRLSSTDTGHQLADIVGAMRDARAGETELDSSGDLEEAARHNKDALAALRRISRESAESSNLIDRAARHLNAALSKLDLTHVVIVNAERIDRPSLKMLARSCLLASHGAFPVWIWTAADVGPEKMPRTIDAKAELPATARRGILAAIKAILDPTESDFSTTGKMIFVPANTHASDIGIGGAAGQLSNLNYDRCAQWIAGQPDSNVDACRFASLVMVNLGLHEAAVDTLYHAIRQCPDAALQCHMWYIAGLVWSKRRYDIAQSNLCFDRAEAALDAVGARTTGDPAMERAWVHNGRAMNAILAARLTDRPIKDAFPVAFDQLRKAFELVRDGRARDRIYLRYNLLGNMSSLMEIGGNYTVALDLLNRTFDESLAHGTENEREWLAQQRCMRASLAARSGDIATAVPIFNDARALMIETDRPVWAEALGRSEATARFQSGDIEGAHQVFAKCLDEARALRSRLGVEIHAAGLAACQAGTGRTRDAIATLRFIGAQEDVWLVDRQALDQGDLSDLRVRDTYYGPSLSIPEVDLEDMAPASVAGALRGRKSEVATAKAMAR